MLSKKEQELLCALEPTAKANNIEIVTVQIVGAKKAPTIRVYIDSGEGVSFDCLSSAQVWVNKIIEALDPFPGAYTLEVSSPGIDRPLRTSAHFKAQIGNKCVVNLAQPQNGRSKFQGEIVSADNTQVVLNVEGKNFELKYSQMANAHLKGEIEFR